MQLHSIKKCFSGKEFVDKVLETGRNYDLLESISDAESPESLRRSVSLGGSHVFSPTGQPIEYTPRYACELGQFLLKERVLILLPKSPTVQESTVLTPQQSLSTEHRRHQLTASYEQHDGFTSSYSQDYSPGSQRNTLSSRGTGASSAESLGHGRPYRYGYHSRSTGIGQVRDPAPEFMNSPNTFYKFADSEDKEQSTQYQNQILIASSHSPPQPPVGGVTGQRTGSVSGADTCNIHTDLSNAKQNTLLLLFDLLVQRARREKRVKQFLQTPRALEAQALKRANPPSNCDLIFKM